MKTFVNVAAFLLISTASVLAQDSRPWPQYRGPDRTNVSRERGLLQKWPSQGPQLVWKAVGMGEGIASVSIANGRIYTSGSHKGEDFAIALDERTGQRIWMTHLGQSARESPLMRWLCHRTPTADGDRIYLVTVTGELHCLRAADGRLLWRKNYVADFGAPRPAFGFCDYPLVDGEQLICAPGAAGAAIVALEKQSGQVIWKCGVPDEIRGNYAAVVPAELGGTKQYVTCLKRSVVGISAADGKLLWRHEGLARQAMYAQTPMTRGNVILAPNGYFTGLGAIEVLKTGQELKTRELYQQPVRINGIGESSALSQDRLYLVQNNDQPGCIDAETGKTHWLAPRDKGQGRPSLIVADGLVIVRFSNGVVTLLAETKDKYDERGSFALPDHSAGFGASAPAIANGKLYLRDDNTLFCYDLRADSTYHAGWQPAVVQLAAPVLPKPAENRLPLVGKDRAPDAIFVPTPQDVVEKMLDMAKVTRDDKLVDLGSGDGRIPVTAAKKFGAKSVGYEIDPDLVKTSRETVQKEKLEEMVKIEHEDIFTRDLSQFDVVTVYLPAPLLERLLPQLQKLKPGSRIVSHYFEIPGIKPDEVATIVSNEDGNQHKLYLWKCPLSKVK